MKSVIVVIGAGSIGQAIVRRISAGKHVLLADLRAENAETAAKTLTDAGFEASTVDVDVSSRASVQALVAGAGAGAAALGEVTGVIYAAGVSPSQASPETILKVDLYGTALVLELFGDVIATVALEWSLRRSQVIACRRCLSSRMPCWPPRRLKI